MGSLKPGRTGPAASSTHLRTQSSPTFLWRKKRSTVRVLIASLLLNRDGMVSIAKGIGPFSFSGSILDCLRATSRMTIFTARRSDEDGVVMDIATETTGRLSSGSASLGSMRVPHAVPGAIYSAWRGNSPHRILNTSEARLHIAHPFSHRKSHDQRERYEQCCH